MADDLQNTELEPEALSPAPASPPPSDAPAAGGDVPKPVDPGSSVDSSVKEAIALLNDGAKGGEVRARGADGKFIAKTEAAPAAAAPVVAPKDSATVDGKPAAPEQPSTAALKPPTSWSPEAKTEFTKLSPAVQAAVIKREAEVSDGFARVSGEAKAYKSLDAIMAPHRPSLAKLGYQNDGQAISRMLELQQEFSRDPVSMIRQLAASARVDLRQLAAQTPTSSVPAAVAPIPAAASLTPAQIEAIADQRYAKRDASNTIAKFEDDTKPDGTPKHPHAKDPAVKRNMALALSAGTATNLDEAYQAAVYMDPKLRAAEIAAASAPKPNPAVKVAAARSAAVSLRGSAPNGNAGTLPANFTGSTEDAVRQSIALLSGRA